MFTLHSGFISVFFSFLQQNKEEVMAVRLREADNIAAMAELQQHISELEIQVQIRTELSQHNTYHPNLVLSQHCTIYLFNPG